MTNEILKDEILKDAELDNVTGGYINHWRPPGITNAQEKPTAQQSIFGVKEDTTAYFVH